MRDRNAFAPITAKRWVTTHAFIGTKALRSSKETQLDRIAPAALRILLRYLPWLRRDAFIHLQPRPKESAWVCVCFMPAHPAGILCTSKLWARCVESRAALCVSSVALCLRADRVHGRVYLADLDLSALGIHRSRICDSDSRSAHGAELDPKIAFASALLEHALPQAKARVTELKEASNRACSGPYIFQSSSQLAPN